MINFHLFKKGKTNEYDIDDILHKLKDGDRDLREKFIYDHKPYILKTISGTLGKFVDAKNSEEFSIGLSAFNEAIDRYDPKKNKSFFKFCDQVITSRIIDHIRKNQKNNNTYPFTYFENEENNNFEEKYMKIDLSNQFEKIEIRQEIEMFIKELGSYSITIKDLITDSPKHKDSRRLCIRIARIMADNEWLYDKFVKKKIIPVTELAKLANVNIKTIERNRKFIIAVSLILKSNLEVAKEFVKNAEKGGTGLDR